jgi:hypothetical protein
MSEESATADPVELALRMSRREAANQPTVNATP